MNEQVFSLPLSNVPQDFAITLGGRQLRMTCKWNENDGWLFDLYDGVTQEPLVMALPLVTGEDLLAQYGYLGIPGMLIVFTDGDQFATPTQTNLGVESNVYYLVEA